MALSTVLIPCQDEFTIPPRTVGYVNKRRNFFQADQSINDDYQRRLGSFGEYLPVWPSAGENIE
jgi:hypothetical protein